MLTRFGNTKLHLVGPAGTCDCTWALFSLFRDNVEHQLEQQARHHDFRAVRGIARIIGTSRQALVSARELYSEVLSAWAITRDVPAPGLAMSIRTAALINNAWPLPDATHTLPVSQMGWPLAIPCDQFRTVAEILDPIISGLLRVTESATRPDLVRVWPDATSVDADPQCVSPAMRA